ncbi:MAG: alpha/beta hydrolase [Ruminococcaceae bacterium]|nr:alpha/beta hydrolase [Oscillospiraceae bacterium]
MSNVRFEEFTFPSSNKRDTVHAYLFAPIDTPPRAVIQLSHGMCEYVLRYDLWARRFAAEGFVFCGNDHIGHGNTAPREEELGFMGGEADADHLVEDLHTMSSLMRERFKGLPLVLYGHSMGSFVARLYLSRYGKELAAALISGTAGPGQPTGLGKGLAAAIEKVKGDHHRSKLLTSVAFGSYNKRFAREKDEFSWLTRDESVRRAYAADPFCRFVFTTAAYQTLFSLLGRASSKKWAQTVPKSLPILIFSGSEDPVGGNGKGVRSVTERLRRAGHTAVTERIYEGGRHEMHNELCRDEVFADLMNYLNDVLKTEDTDDT